MENVYIIYSKRPLLLTDNSYKEVCICELFVQIYSRKSFTLYLIKHFIESRHINQNQDIYHSLERTLRM